MREREREREKYQQDTGLQELHTFIRTARSCYESLWYLDTYYIFERERERERSCYERGRERERERERGRDRNISKMQKWCEPPQLWFLFYVFFNAFFDNFRSNFTPFFLTFRYISVAGKNLSTLSQF